MKSDPVSYRMIFVAAKEGGRDRWHSGHELWREGAGLALVPIEFSTYDAIAAESVLTREKVDFCVLDARLHPSERALVLAAKHPVHPRPKMILAGLSATSPEPGIDLALPAPVDPGGAHKLVNLCLRMRIPTRVLIVDDSAVMRAIVRKVLDGSKFAFDTAEVSDGPAAVVYLERSEPAIVFTDFNMVGMNGLQLLAHIRRCHPNVAVVMITSSQNDEVADKAHGAGVLAFLRKPFYSEHVDALMLKYLQHHNITA
jgi:CheY-like chemotaxis protein